MTETRVQGDLDVTKTGGKLFRDEMTSPEYSVAGILIALDPTTRIRLYFVASITPGNLLSSGSRSGSGSAKGTFW